MGLLKDSLTPSTLPVSASFAMEAIPRSAPPHSACTGVNWSEVMVAVTAAAGAAAATESADERADLGARRARRLEGTRCAPETNADRRCLFAKSPDSDRASLGEARARAEETRADAAGRSACAMDDADAACMVPRRPEVARGRE